MQYPDRNPCVRSGLGEIAESFDRRFEHERLSGRVFHVSDDRADRAGTDRCAIVSPHDPSADAEDVA